jgi:hypothetical protein
MYTHLDELPNYGLSVQSQDEGCSSLRDSAHQLIVNRGVHMSFLLTVAEAFSNEGFSALLTAVALHESSVALP